MAKEKITEQTNKDNEEKAKKEAQEKAKLEAEKAKEQAETKAKLEAEKIRNETKAKKMKTLYDDWDEVEKPNEETKNNSKKEENAKLEAEKKAKLAAEMTRRYYSKLFQIILTYSKLFQLIPIYRLNEKHAIEMAKKQKQKNEAEEEGQKNTFLQVMRLGRAAIQNKKTEVNPPLIVNNSG